MQSSKGHATSSTGARRLPQWLGFALAAGTFGALLWLERRRPLRRSVESKLSHGARNLAVAIGGAIVTGLVERPVVERIARRVERERLGLLKQVRLPIWLEFPLAVALLDYTLYLWHYLTHKVPFLWRFHVVHHVDLDMDASTALRFHFAELIVSIPYRAAQVRLLGISPLALSAWQTLLFMSVIFHHSNLELSIEIERKLNRFVVTPRMHGIHHSIVKAESNSNWSSGFTVWDYLHGTLRRDVPQDEIVIGVPAYRESEAVTLEKIIELPFVAQPSAWQLPEGVERIAKESRVTRKILSGESAFA